VHVIDVSSTYRFLDGCCIDRLDYSVLVFKREIRLVGIFCRVNKMYYSLDVALHHGCMLMPDAHSLSNVTSFLF